LGKDGIRNWEKMGLGIGKRWDYELGKDGIRNWEKMGLGIGKRWD
jgi:hypothetical protein